MTETSTGDGDGSNAEAAAVTIAKVRDFVGSLSPQERDVVTRLAMAMVYEDEAEVEGFSVATSPAAGFANDGVNYGNVGFGANTDIAALSLIVMMGSSSGAQADLRSIVNAKHTRRRR